MNQVYLTGLGAVSPAGWGIDPLLQAVTRGLPLDPATLTGPPGTRTFPVRTVPSPAARPTFLAHPRLRRASAISHFALGAALEALSGGPDPLPEPAGRLGIILCTMCGGVRYTRRFLHEAWQDPATASPLLFPETVFNAPTSHLAAFLGSAHLATSLIGDPGVFLQGVALGAQWLLENQADRCLVIGAEECDWSAARAWGTYVRGCPPAEGAAALLLQRDPLLPSDPVLEHITTPASYAALSRLEAVNATRHALPTPAPGEILVSSNIGSTRLDAAESACFADWPGPRVTPKRILGEGLVAASAWQCALAAALLRGGTAPAATVMVVGCNQQAIAARFALPTRPNT